MSLSTPAATKRAIYQWAGRAKAQPADRRNMQYPPVGRKQSRWAMLGLVMGCNEIR